MDTLNQGCSLFIYPWILRTRIISLLAKQWKRPRQNCFLPTLRPYIVIFYLIYNFGFVLEVSLAWQMFNAMSETKGNYINHTNAKISNPNFPYFCTLDMPWTKIQETQLNVNFSYVFSHYWWVQCDIWSTLSLKTPQFVWNSHLPGHLFCLAVMHELCRTHGGNLNTPRLCHRKDDGWLSHSFYAKYKQVALGRRCYTVCLGQGKLGNGKVKNGQGFIFFECTTGMHRYLYGQWWIISNHMEAQVNQPEFFCQGLYLYCMLADSVF